MEGRVAVAVSLTWTTVLEYGLWRYTTGNVLSLNVPVADGIDAVAGRRTS